jgi:hypothetical protein
MAGSSKALPGQKAAADCRALRLTISIFHPPQYCPPSAVLLRRTGLLSRFQLFEHARRALAAETSTLERTLSDLVNQAYGLTPTEIELI